jgi:hypothetical protein
VKNAEVKGGKRRKLGFLITAGELRNASEDSNFVLHVVIEAVSNPQVNTWSGKAVLRHFSFAPIQYQTRRP